MFGLAARDAQRGSQPETDAGLGRRRLRRISLSRSLAVRSLAIT